MSARKCHARKCRGTTDQPYTEFRKLGSPKLEIDDNEIIQKIQGSLVGLAIGDALGASVEFRPNEYLKQHPVTEMHGGGTWSLQAGQWTDDTSMALCLAASLIITGKSDPYDQFVRYKRWYRNGYMSSTGKCFDIGKSTRQAIKEFEKRQDQVVEQMLENSLCKKNSSPPTEEFIRDCFHLFGFNFECGPPDSAGNGCLMRLAPIPLFFFQSYENVKRYIDDATKLTHNDQRAIHACQFYAGLIWHALRGVSKQQLLHPNFYEEYLKISLHEDVLEIARGSYKKKKNGYEDGIRGKGYVLYALEAALWAFYRDEGLFEKGVLAAVNLGDDTDTTAAIYGQLAGAVYGLEKIPPHWIKQLFEGKFIMTIAKCLYIKGQQFGCGHQKSNWSDENEQERTQTNMNNREHDHPTTNKPYKTYSTQDAKKHSTSDDQAESTHRTSHHHQPTDVDSTSRHGQSANKNNKHSSEQLISASNMSHHRHPENPDGTLHQENYDNTNIGLKIKPKDKVISE